MGYSSFAEYIKDDSEDQFNDRSKLAKLGKDIILRRDIFGRTILQICILSNDATSFGHLLRNPETRYILTATDYENGWNILHYIFYHKRLRCFNTLVKFLDSRSANLSHALPDLLRRKDRSRVAPLSLLQNDIKDFFWAPQYINERNEFHLARRFPETEKHISSGSDGNPRTGGMESNTNRSTIGTQTNGSENSKTLRGRVSDLINNNHDWWFDTRGGSDVFVFGTNTNDNLGMGDSHDRSIPSRIRVLQNKDGLEDLSLREILKTPRYRFIVMSKYHSVLCTTDGKLYTCGIGSRGRLGHGNVSNSNRFKEVNFPRQRSPIVACAASNNHSVALSACGTLYGWGQNTLNQLGFTSCAPKHSFKVIADVYENSPVEIISGDLRRNTVSLRGVEVSKIHTIAYTSHSLFFWGLNIGQIMLSHEGKVSDHRVNDKSYKGTIVPQPKEIELREEIKFVATCETCTCVVTTQNEIIVYYMGQRVKLPRIMPRVSAEASFDFFKPSKLTIAPVIKKVAMKTQSTVHILLETGDVMSFGITSKDVKMIRSVRYTLAWSASDLSMRAVDIDNSFDGSLIVCTRNGSVLIRSNSTSNVSRRGSFSTIAGPGNKKFRRLGGANRVLRVSCNDTFSSFAFIRDDIDPLPLKLQKNDFYQDMDYLSPFVEPNMYRKQNQLLDIEHNINYYITDFIYPSNLIQSAYVNRNALYFGQSQDTQTDAPEEEDTKTDMLRAQMLRKFSPLRNKEPGTSTVFQKLREVDLKAHLRLLKHSLYAKSFPVSFHCSEDKFVDGKIEFSHDPDFSIGIHTEILRKRSPLCRQIFSPRSASEYFIHQNIKGKYIRESKTILFESKVEPLSVLVFVYYVYTNTLLDFWMDSANDGSASETDKKKLAQIRSDYFVLVTLFKMDIFSSKDDVFLEQFQALVGDEASTDVTIGLSNMEFFKCSSSIIARSAFFETVLSGRWETKQLIRDTESSETFEQKYIGLENIDMLHMKIVLKHFQGCHDLHVFDEAHEIVMESDDPDDFVNLLLEMIEIADELLLEQLKHLCELAIKDLINIDNVLILLRHAEHLGANKLFMCCCWYIYHNLDLILFDSNFTSLEEELLQAVEAQLRILDKCKHPQFVTGDQEEVNCKVFYDTSSFTNKSFSTFLEDFNAYNEIFMSDAKGFSKFEPLIDVKEDLDSTEERRKSSGRKTSIKDSHDGSEVQKHVSSELILKIGPQSGIFSSCTDDLAKSQSDSAIVEVEEFEVVTNKKRKSRARSVICRNKDVNPVEIITQPEKQVSLVLKSTPSPRIETPSTRNENVPSRSNVHTPILGEVLNIEKKTTKIKFAPQLKLSQKERRKLRGDTMNGNPQAQKECEKKQQNFRTPWRVPEVAAGGRDAVNSQTNIAKISSLPILGQKKAPTPKLSAIILEETTRLAEQSEPIVTQTLQEIQQEQEFAKWWEEECKRVQQQETMLNGIASESQSQRISKKGRKSRRGKGKQESSGF